MTSEKNGTTGPSAKGEECPMCLLGTLCEGTTTLTLERGETTIVPKEVAANVCDVCGEAFMEEEVVEAGAWFDVRRWKRAQKSIA